MHFIVSFLVVNGSLRRARKKFILALTLKTLVVEFLKQGTTLGCASQEKQEMIDKDRRLKKFIELQV